MKVVAHDDSGRTFADTSSLKLIAVSSDDQRLTVGQEGGRIFEDEFFASHRVLDVRFERKKLGGVALSASLTGFLAVKEIPGLVYLFIFFFVLSNIFPRQTHTAELESQLVAMKPQAVYHFDVVKHAAFNDSRIVLYHDKQVTSYLEIVGGSGLYEFYLENVTAFQRLETDSSRIVRVYFVCYKIRFIDTNAQYSCAP